MFKSLILSASAAALIGASFIAAPTPVKADGKDFLGGVFIGTVGTLIGKDIQKKNQEQRNQRATNSNRQHRSTAARSSSGCSNQDRFDRVGYYLGPPSPSITGGRQIQSALNFFGFNVGCVDGKVGPGTRKGIADFQYHNAWDPTGYLTEQQKEILIEGWLLGERTEANGDYQIEGRRGLLSQVRAWVEDDREINEDGLFTIGR